jgi:hypothetical protein
MSSHPLGDLDAPAVGQIVGDTGGAEGVAADSRSRCRQSAARRRTMYQMSVRDIGFAPVSFLVLPIGGAE